MWSSVQNILFVKFVNNITSNTKDYGKFNGTPCIALKQTHKAGTTTFALNDSKLYIVAADDKPIKFVNAGEGYMDERDPSMNEDLTKEYVYIQNMGCGAICSAPLGIYTITA